MLKINYTQTSKNNLKEIYNFISNDDVIYAEKVIDSILGYIGGLISTFPQIGKKISNKGHRQATETTFKYNIIYKIINNEIRIIYISKYKNINL